MHCLFAKQVSLKSLKGMLMRSRPLSLMNQFIVNKRVMDDDLEALRQAALQSMSRPQQQQNKPSTSPTKRPFHHQQRHSFRPPRYTDPNFGRQGYPRPPPPPHGLLRTPLLRSPFVPQHFEPGLPLDRNPMFMGHQVNPFMNTLALNPPHLPPPDMHFQRPFLRPDHHHPHPRFQQRPRFPRLQRREPYQSTQTNLVSQTPSVSEGSSDKPVLEEQETRRLPGRFSRIDRSESGSEDEDDRLDKFCDEEGSQVNGPHDKPDQLIPVETEEEEDYSLLNEILEDVEEQDDLDQDLLASGDEYDLYSDDKNNEKEGNDPLPPVSHEPEVKPVVESKSSSESIVQSSSCSDTVSSTVKTISLKTPLTSDAVERRKRKFGVISDEGQPSQPNTRKIRSLLVLKK